MNSSYWELLFYFLLNSIVFLVFFILITIFGLFFFKIIVRYLLKCEISIHPLRKIFLSFSIGCSIFISLMYIYIIFKIFNFYFVYLPIIIIDMLYFTYLFTSGGLRRDLRSQYIENLKKTIHKNYPCIFKIVLSLVVIFIIQITVQWQVITRSKSLVSSDPFFYLKNIYYLIDNQTISPEINYFYVPGHIILCAAISLIYKDYVLIYYFLKFGGIFFLFLFVLVIFFLGLSIFRKIHMSFICSLLLLSFYLYTWRINAFYSSSLAVFFFGTSLL